LEGKGGAQILREDDGEPRTFRERAGESLEQPTSGGRRIRKRFPKLQRKGRDSERILSLKKRGGKRETNWPTDAASAVKVPRGTGREENPSSQNPTEKKTKKD